MRSRIVPVWSSGPTVGRASRSSASSDDRRLVLPTFCGGPRYTLQRYVDRPPRYTPGTHPTMRDRCCRSGGVGLVARDSLPVPLSASLRAYGVLSVHIELDATVARQDTFGEYNQDASVLGSVVWLV
jgi:hypothetical protein